MGVNIRDIVIRHEIKLEDFRGKILSVDAFNILYQFLASIRQRDGTPLTDSKGRVTSHLVGLLSRSARLMEHGIRLVFVFDGKAPKLKELERQRRSQLKDKAYEEYKKAKEDGNLELMHKFSSRTSRLTPDMVESAKQLLDALGIPYMVAPSEGEAQAAHLVKRGDVYATISQDYDNLLFGVPRLLQNVTLSEKRKMPSKLSYESVKPMLVDLEENLKVLGLSQRQLIALALLVGTDFNPDGIPKIGPKNALKLVKEYKEDYDALFDHVRWRDFYSFPYTDVFSTLEDMPVDDNYTLQFRNVDEDRLIHLLCDECGFSKDRVMSAAQTMSVSQKANTQKSLFEF